MASESRQNMMLAAEDLMKTYFGMGFNNNKILSLLAHVEALYYYELLAVIGIRVFFSI